MAAQILLVSPREPSGATWLVNCLLELGIRVNFKPAIDRAWRSAQNPGEPSGMWQPAAGGRWRLHPRAEALVKWLPVLVRNETLSFRDDIEVLYVQDLPRSEFSNMQAALFVRDPRDAIQSLYRRVRPAMSIEDFVRFPHHETMLDAVAHWDLFVESWMAREGVRVYRFEEYKADAHELLSRIANDFGIEATQQDIARAVAESTFEKARAAEEQYRALHPDDEEVAMRAGRVGEWKSSPEFRELSAEIEKRAGPLLVRLGYDVSGNPETASDRDRVSHLRFLSIFKRIDLPPGFREKASAADPMQCPLLLDILEFASTVDAGLIRRARLQAREARMLLESLQEYVSAWDEHQRRRIQAAYSEFEDGADYHLSRIRELLASRRRGDAKMGT